MKRLRNALNERNVDGARQMLQEVLELNEDIQAIVEHLEVLKPLGILIGN